MKPIEKCGRKSLKMSSNCVSFSALAHASPSGRKTDRFVAGDFVRQFEQKQQSQQCPSSRHPHNQVDGADMSRIFGKIEKQKSRN